MRRAAAAWLGLIALALTASVAFAARPAATAAKQKGKLVNSPIVVQRAWPPVVTIRAVVGSGSLADPAGQEGLALLCWTTALRGAGDRDRSEIAEKLEALGAHVDFSVDKLSVTVVGEVLADQLDAFIPLFSDILTRPRFDPAEIELARTQLLSDVVESRDDDDALAHDALPRYLYRGQPAGRPTGGTEKSLAAIDGAAVKSWHQKHAVAANLRFGFAGAIDATAAQTIAQTLAAKLSMQAQAKPPNFGKIGLSGRRLLLIDKPRRTQAQVLIAQPLVASTHKDSLALQVANAVLGGAFTSRLNREIRELRGWSYSTWSAISSAPQAGTLALGFSPGNRDVAPAIELAVKIVAELQQHGVTAAELRFAKDFLKGAHRASLETADHELAQRLHAIVLGLPADEIDTLPARIESIDVKAVNRALHEHLHPLDLVAVVVGSAKILREKLENSAAQFAVEVIAADAAPESTTGVGRAVSKIPVAEPPPTAPNADSDSEEEGETGPDEDGEAPEQAKDPTPKDKGEKP